jgi:peptide/nickel transport system permease protein
MFTAPSVGAWWTFIPCSLVISLLTFALYMMNSGMDEIFNPKIRR